MQKPRCLNSRFHLNIEEELALNIKILSSISMEKVDKDEK